MYTVRPGDLRAFNLLRILVTSSGEHRRRLRSWSLITWSNNGKLTRFSAVKTEAKYSFMHSAMSSSLVSTLPLCGYRWKWRKIIAVNFPTFVVSSITAVQHMNSFRYLRIIHSSREIWTQLIGLAPNVWLHSSVGRASHRCRGGHGFESRWNPDFFSGFFFPTA